jgi:hypothetical protein
MRWTQVKVKTSSHLLLLSYTRNGGLLTITRAVLRVVAYTYASLMQDFVLHDPDDRPFTWSPVDIGFIFCRVRFTSVLPSRSTCYPLFADSSLYIARMEHVRPGLDVSLSKLLDTIEERLDAIAESLRYDTDTTPSKRCL